MLQVTGKHIAQGFDDKCEGLASDSEKRRNRKVLMLEMDANQEFKDLFNLVRDNEIQKNYFGEKHPHGCNVNGEIIVHMTLGILKDEYVDFKFEDQGKLKDVVFTLDTAREITTMW